MKINIPIHSIVDVITNSSSVIYTWATDGSIEIIKEVINEVLSAASSEKTADDLFDFSLQKLPSEGVYDWLRWNEDDEENLPANIAAIFKQVEGFEGDSDAKGDHINALIQKHESELFAHFDDMDNGWDAPRVLQHLVIKTKDGVDTTFSDRIMKMFDSEDYRDG